MKFLMKLQNLGDRRGIIEKRAPADRRPQPLGEGEKAEISYFFFKNKK